MLQGTVGVWNPLGRVFTAEDVTEASRICNAVWDVKFSLDEGCESSIPQPCSLTCVLPDARSGIRGRAEQKYAEV